MSQSHVGGTEANTISPRSALVIQLLRHYRCRTLVQGRFGLNQAFGAGKKKAANRIEFT